VYPNVNDRFLEHIRTVWHEEDGDEFLKEALKMLGMIVRKLSLNGWNVRSRRISLGENRCRVCSSEYDGEEKMYVGYVRIRITKVDRMYVENS
jgi:hypothetical protein